MHKTILLGALAVFLGGSLPVWAQSVFIVDRLTDTGEGEGLMGDLRYCITNAVDGDAITFDVIGTISLTRALPSVTHDISIEGPGANLLAVRRGSTRPYSIFTLMSGTARISGLMIMSGFGQGGGVHNQGDLTISNSTISGNQSDQGGGIFNVGTLTINKTTISGNFASTDGGGIFNSGILTISNSTISGNYAGPIEGHSAVGRGGGIFNSGMVSISNSTISDNQTFGDEEPFFYLDSYGGGIHNSGSLLYMRNTILAWNRSDRGPDLYSTVISLGHNLIGNTHEGSGFDKTDLLDANPMLGPLQDNGGQTFTHALLPDSPAIDAGDNTDAPDFDQRGEGFPRIVNGIIDIGAFEFQKPGSPR